jgi:anhydro-N-acetylmuramic acid kinase
MSRLSALQKKKTKTVIGLLSGTSADGIDAVVVRVRGNGVSTRVRQLAFATYRYPPALRTHILSNSLPGTGSVDQICKLNILLGYFFADAARRVARKAGLTLDKIDLIGSHGQTVHHLPRPHTLFGKTIRSGLQLGDPSTIAKLTGVVTVGDFRTSDMAVGGQGAPLVPYFDFLMFRSDARNRILLNLGGIANFTALPRRCSAGDVRAFDTGPANMVIDGLMMKLYGKKYDAGGRVARSGTVLPDLLADLMAHRYFSRRPPKSTGREMFGAMLHPRILKKERRPNDIIATVTRWTALAVYDQYRRFIQKKMNADELIVSGGGVHNREMMRALKELFHPIPVKTMETVGFSSDAKEAVCFAVLANETISETPSNVPRVTGAKKTVVLGKICL